MPYKDPSKLSTLTTKLSAEVAEEVRQLAAKNGVTPSKMVAILLTKALKEGTDMSEPKVQSKEKTVVTYKLWESTAQAMLEIAQQSGVPVDDLVNGVLCEFISSFGK